MENAQDELNREIGIECHSGFLVTTDRSIAFDREQRAELFVRQLSDGFGKIMHCFALLARERKNGVPAELGQATPKLWLKNYDQSDREEDRKTPDEPADHDQV